MKRSFTKLCFPQTEPSRPFLYAFLLLGFLIPACFYGVSFNEFVEFDDESYIYGNFKILDGYSKDSLLWAWTSFDEGNWHPLTWMSHMLDIELFGFEPAGHHWVNVFIHTSNALLLFSFLYGATGRYGASLCVAVLFAIHPLRVESVAWAAERKDVLSAFFYLFALLCYSRYAKYKKRSMYACAFICMALGLTAKAMPVTLPVLLLILDYWPLNRYPSDMALRKFISLAIEKIPLFALSLAASITAFRAQDHHGAVSSFPLFERIAQSLTGYMDYILKFFFPANLAVLYPYERGVFLQKTLLALVVLSAISIWIIKNRKNRPWAFTGWLWFLATMLPVIGIVKIGLQSIADRYTYLPQIGLAIIVCWGALQAVDASPKLKSFLPAAGLFAAVCLMLLTVRQVKYWQSSETLYRRTLKIAPVNFLINEYLGVVYFKKGMHDEAAEYFKKSVRINPYYARGHMSLGGYLYTKGRLKEAEKEFLISLVLDPKLEKSQYYLNEIYKDPEWEGP